jgi:nucleoside-diphosphate-sugar epimerase
MNKRVVLTGATGFLGSHLAAAMRAAGYEVIALKRRSSSLHRVAAISSELKMVDVDAIDFNRIFTEFGKVDAIIHTATCYGRNNESVSEIFSANTEFPLRLLDAGTRAGVRAFLNTDTILDKYLNLYAFSKNQLLEWGKFFSLQKKITFWNLRLEHFYGAGDDPTKFTAHVINSCLVNTPELKLTLGEQRRDFIHVSDVVSAYMTLLAHIDDAEPRLVEYDIGSGHSVSIRNFVETVKRITNSTTSLNFGALPYREGEIMQSAANTQALADLGWCCTYDIEHGIRQVVEMERNSS